MRVVVISYTIPHNRYDRNGRLVERKGDVVVSHGVNVGTGKTVILPCEPFNAFTDAHCYWSGGEAYLK